MFDLDLSYSILQRAGVVPMSIAGIAKEVSTILISSWFFGDKLTLLNAVGVTITVCGMLSCPNIFKFLINLVTTWFQASAYSHTTNIANP